MSSQSGLALASLLIAIVLLLAFTSFAVRQTALDQRSTSHVATGHRALFAAESGVMHALNRINGMGVIDFENDVSDRWDEIFGLVPVTMSLDPEAQYEVTAAADPADPVNRGVLTAVGRAPLLARRVVRIGLAKGAFGGASGAIHIAEPGDVEASFKGNAFDVDGNNHDRFGNLVGDGVVKPGISTLNSAVKDDVVDSLKHNQIDNVRGAGFDPGSGTPSVMEASAPDLDALDRFVADLIGRPGAVITDQSNFNGNDTFGTIESPQITYMTDPNVRLNGNAQGAGILIVDGSITINGTLDFIGLVMVRGATTVNSGASPYDDTVVTGNAMILGSLWTGNLNFTVGGSAIVDYCHECLWLVDDHANTAGTIPRPMRVVSWSDV